MPLDSQPAIPDGWELVTHLTAVTMKFILEMVSVKIQSTTSIEGGTMVTYTTNSDKTMAILSVGGIHCMLRQRSGSD